MIMGFGTDPRCEQVKLAQDWIDSEDEPGDDIRLQAVAVKVRPYLDTWRNLIAAAGNDTFLTLEAREHHTEALRVFDEIAALIRERL